MKIVLSRLLRSSLLAVIIVALASSVIGAPDLETVVQRVRAELAAILKTEAAKLPVDKPVSALGADELDLVEWVMAVEEAFHVAIPEEKIAGRKGRETRPDLTITLMAGIVMEQLKEGGRKSGGGGK